jgi:hypothetical protein
MYISIHHATRTRVDGSGAVHMTALCTRPTNTSKLTN